MRLACSYCVSPSEMQQHLLDSPWIPGAIPEPSAVSRWRASGVLPIDMASSPRGSGDCAISGYCPLCASYDLRRNELPHFRSGWQNPWRTHCSVHRTPLFSWPYSDNEELVMYPDFFEILQRRGWAAMKENLKAQKFSIQLRYAREVQRWMHERDPRSLAWRQQLDHEQALLFPHAAPIAALAGCSEAGQLRRTVSDLACLLGNEFGTSIRCPATYLGSFLGPVWMFARSFEKRKNAGRIRCLRSFPEPEQRRTLITLAMRILGSFSIEASFDREGHLTDVGYTSITSTLRDCPLAAWKWVFGRIHQWPAALAVGLRTVSPDTGEQLRKQGKRKASSDIQ
jgi:hypothetical protein